MKACLPKAASRVFLHSRGGGGRGAVVSGESIGDRMTESDENSEIEAAPSGAEEQTTFTDELKVGRLV